MSENCNFSLHRATIALHFKEELMKNIKQKLIMETTNTYRTKKNANFHRVYSTFLLNNVNRSR